MDEKVEKKKKILIIAIIAVVVIDAAFAVWYFLFRSSKIEISLDNGRFYPEFSEDTTDYIIYTTEDTLNFSCTGGSKLGGGVQGCEPVAIAAGNSSYSIPANGKTYTFQITKLSSSDTTLKIKSVTGAPTKWVSSATLVVNVENSGSVKELEYSFDGGKTWQSKDSRTIGENGTYRVQARDYFGFLSDVKTVKVEKIDAIAPAVEISKEVVSDTEVVLTAVATDEASGLKDYKWNTGATGTSITVTKSGSYSITVTDRAGNSTVKNITVTLAADEKAAAEKEKEKSSNSNKSNGSSSLPDTSGGKSSSGGSSSGGNSGGSTPTPTPPAPAKVYRHVAVFNINGASGENVALACESTNVSCAVSAPAITRSGFEILGWSSNADATSAEFQSGASVELYGDVVFYAITKKTVSATFEILNSAAATQSGGSTSCTFYNRATSCALAAPTLTANEGYTALGWSETKNSKTASTESGKTIDAASNLMFYSVTFKEVSVAFSVLLPDNGGATESSLSCQLYNSDATCQVEPPAVASTETYKFLGWSTYYGAEEPDFLAGAKIPISGGEYYYAIFDPPVEEPEPLEFTATFVVQDTSAATTAKTEVSCSTTRVNYCEIDLPTLTAKTGYTAVGWAELGSATDPKSLTSATATGLKLRLTKDVTLYSVTYLTAPKTATFTIKDASTASKSGGTSSCNLYNGATSCEVTAPILTGKSGFAALGWDENASSTSATHASGAKIALTSDKEFFAIVAKGITLSFRMNDSAAGSISGSATLTCTLTGTETTCSKTLPAVTLNSGYALVGWATSSSAATVEFAAGATVTVSSDTVFYAITKRVVETTFVLQDSAASSYGTNKISCDLINGASSCNIVAPSPSMNSGFSLLGWNPSSSATTAHVSPGASLAVSTNSTFYSVTRKTSPLVATFTLQNSASATVSGGTPSCYLYNGASSCNITAPTLTPKSSSYSVVGWNTDRSATTATLNSGASTLISANTVFYSIVGKSVTINFNKNTTFTTAGIHELEGNSIAASSLSFSTATCAAFGTETRCNTTNFPRIYSPGNEVWGFASSTTAYPFYTRRSSNLFPDGFTVYARVFNWNKGSAFNYASEAKINVGNAYNDYIPIEIESGISLTVANRYVEYYRTFANNVPAVKLLNGKLRFMTESTYNAIGTDTVTTDDDYEGSAGITLVGYGVFAPMDILMYSNNAYVEDTEHVLVHETGHAIDAMFYDYTGKFLHEYSEFASAFSSTKSLNPASRPLDDYAYSDDEAYEFLAEAFSAYYRDVFGGYAREELGSQAPGLNAAFAKYLCIAENNFNMEASCP